MTAKVEDTPCTFVQRHYSPDPPSTIGTEGQLIVIGTEGHFRVTAAQPKRMWLKTSTLGSEKSWYSDTIIIPGSGYSLTSERGYVTEGMHQTSKGRRIRFYCRLIPDDAFTREELARHDESIKIAEAAVAAAKAARQVFLEDCARHGKKVPVPPQPPKPAR